MDSFPLIFALIIPQVVLGQALSGDASQASAADTARVMGPWTEWTACGQTCGYGTQYRIRRCHRSSSSGDCEGPTKQMKICNDRDCPPWHEDYRSVECSKHNQISYGGRKYQWIPYINEASPCQLSCKSVGFGYYAKFKKSVADGVTCTEDNTGVCLKGQCVMAGCDGILRSQAKPDRCGVCDGRGDTCQLFSGIFTRTHLKRRGYNVVLTIPAGARSINVSEMAASKNFLALSSPAGHFLNGNRLLQQEGSIEGVGTTFNYSRRKGPSCKGECLTADGPTNATLSVELLYFGRNPGIFYSYTVPNGHPGPAQEEDAVPVDGNNASRMKVRIRDSPVYLSSPANERRSGGRQQLNQRAVKNPNPEPRRPTSALANDAYHQHHRNGHAHQRRRLRHHPMQRLSPLASKLHDSYNRADDGRGRDYPPFSSSSSINRSDYQSRGSDSRNDYPQPIRGGYQTITSTNGNRYTSSSRSGSEDGVVNGSDRPDNGRGRQPKIAASHNDSLTPNLTKPAPQYRHYYHTNELDDLGDVPVKGQIPRDDGKRRPRRKLIRNSRYNNQHRVTTQRHPRPNYVASQSVLDNTIPLPPVRGSSGRDRDGGLTGSSAAGDDSGLYSWRISGFTKCTEPCGGGLQETRVICVKADSQVEVMEENCEAPLKPAATTVVCNNQPCKPSWLVKEWGPCSVTCARGLQKRDVSCQQRITPTLTIPVPDHACSSPRPQSRQYCQLDPCFVWKTSNWTKCSTVCGLGQRTRDLTCVDWKGKKVSEDLCVQIKPKQEEICDMGSCAQGWFHTKWSKKCSSQCGRGFYVRRVYCSAPDGTLLEEDKCSAEAKKPKSKKSCRSSKPCGGQWFAGPWSECNSTCGSDSYRQRDVLCIKKHGKRVRGITKNHNCDDQLKPNSTELCKNLPKCTPQWYMMQWSECSKSCDTGVRTREIKCLDENLKPNPDCESRRKPSRRQSCNTQPCDSNYAAFSDSSGSSSQVLQKDGTIKDVPSCEDKNGTRWCRLASQARLCSYFRSVCCKTCRKLG